MMMAWGFIAAAPLVLAAGPVPFEEFTDYPAGAGANPAVEVVIDKGLVRELIVSCPGRRGEAIIVHSMLEKLYCDSLNTCHDSLDAAIRASCAGS